jgi:hypothetical protein
MLQPFRLFFVRAAIPMELLPEPSEPSVCLDGLSPFRQSNTLSPILDTRKTTPCAAYAHPASFLGRDSATSRGGRLFCNHGPSGPIRYCRGHVHGDTCGRAYISLRPSPTVPHGATLPPILDKSASITTISLPKWALKAMYMYIKPFSQSPVQS